MNGHHKCVCIYLYICRLQCVNICVYVHSKHCGDIHIWTCSLKHEVDCETIFILIFEYLYLSCISIWVFAFDLNFVVSIVTFCVCISTLCTLCSDDAICSSELAINMQLDETAGAALQKTSAEMTTDWRSSPSSCRDSSSLCVSSTFVELHKIHF